jgi:hypothetical protein
VRLYSRILTVDADYKEESFVSNGSRTTEAGGILILGVSPLRGGDKRCEVEFALLVIAGCRIDGENLHGVLLLLPGGGFCALMPLVRMGTILDQTWLYRMHNTMDSKTREIIRGALAAWGTLDRSTRLTLDRGGVVNVLDTTGLRIASVRRGESPIGRIWYIRLGDRRERVFPSVVTALRYLRGHLCPQREAGRVLFGQSESR